MTARTLAACALCLLVLGCGSAPIGDEPVSTDDEVPGTPQPRGGVAAFEQRWRERALSQGRQGRLAEAALSWEVLVALRPDVKDYDELLRQTRRLIDEAVPDRMQRAAQAIKRGDLDAAGALYLSVLALKPDHEAAADALRGIERERNRRSYLGKNSGQVIARRTAPSSSAAAVLDRNDIEHAAMLGTQGEVDAAISLLEAHLAIDKRDAAACRLLARMYAQKAGKQSITGNATSESAQRGRRPEACASAR